MKTASSVFSLSAKEFQSAMASLAVLRDRINDVRMTLNPQDETRGKLDRVLQNVQQVMSLLYDQKQALRSLRTSTVSKLRDSMDPKDFSDQLRQLATSIEKAERPSRRKVANHLKRLIVAMGPDNARSWTVTKYRGGDDPNMFPFAYVATHPNGTYMFHAGSEDFDFVDDVFDLLEDIDPSELKQLMPGLTFVGKLQ